MANLINEDYFIRDINIPANSPGLQSKLTSWITEYQEEVLIKVLGYDLYSKFIVDPILEQRFIDIRDGKEFEFEFCGKTVKRKYIGLSNIKKESLIAYYAYYFIARDNASYTASIGEVKPQGENSITANPSEKLVNAWNKFVELSGLINCRWFDKFDLSSYVHFDDKPSLYNFLLANKDVYPEWEYSSEQAEKINIFGI
jgi:hypothetical protein